MKKYDHYKNSGVDWLGEIPQHWEVLPGLSFIYENKDRNKGMVRNTVLSLSYGNIRVKSDNELTGLVPESFETYQFVNKDDLIFRPTDLQNDTVSLRSSISEYEGIITNAYLNLRFKSKASSKFYHYFFRSIDNNKIIYGLGSGLRQNISYLDFRRFPFPFPPLQEQITIANFLDDKTTKIDQAIALKQKQIELLKERRQILIHKAVTKGLDDTVKFKDSSVEWIGEIPEHWGILTLKQMVSTGIIEFQDGNHGGDYPKENEFCDIGIPFIKPRDMQNGKVLFESSDKLTLERSLKLRIGFAQKNDTLMVNRGGSIGKVCFVKENYDEQPFFIINPQVTYLRAIKDLDSKFLSHLCESNVIQIAVDMILGYGSTFSFLGLGNMGKFPIPLPPVKEQLVISEFINTASSKIATAISLKEKEIEKLKEYKTSLTDSVVTGKVKVC